MASSKHPFLSSVIQDLWYEERTESRQSALNMAIVVRDAIPHVGSEETAELQKLLAAMLLGVPDAVSLHDEARAFAPDAVTPKDDAETGAVRHRIWERIRAARTACATPDKSAMARVEAAFARVKAAHPKLGLSFGYIGDLPSNGWDDRSWRIFTSLSTRMAASCCDISFAGWSTRNMPAMADAVEARLDAWCASQQAKLDAGEIHLVRDRLAA